jgi:hypothetical protein
VGDDLLLFLSQEGIENESALIVSRPSDTLIIMII